ncbi:hypothetical protein [Microvirga massiliensis]|nr:hypothetical protein [Microvirga massiliensis]
MGNALGVLSTGSQQPAIDARDAANRNQKLVAASIQVSGHEMQ